MQTITSSITPAPSIPAKVVSNTPGRLRLRVPLLHRQPEQMERIVSTLATNPHIHQVRSNIHHGSIVIHHHHEVDSRKQVVAALQDLGIIFADITGGKSEAATQVSNTVVDFNQRVKDITDGQVDLRFLFPLGLGILSVRQLILKGLQLDIIPWYVLAWYAFDSFLKLNGGNQGGDLSHPETHNSTSPSKS